MNRKLTQGEVIEIFTSTQSTSMLSALYSVSTNTIRSIKRRRSYIGITQRYDLLPTVPKLSSKKPILDDHTIQEIFYFSGTIRELKDRFGISKKVANNIKFGITYSSVTVEFDNPGELKIHSLSWDDVCSIRASSLSSFTLSLLFKVSVSTIANIKAGRTRKFK